MVEIHDFTSLWLVGFFLGFRVISFLFLFLLGSISSLFIF